MQLMHAVACTTLLPLQEQQLRTGADVRLFSKIRFVSFILIIGSVLSAQTPMGTAFTYQGRLAGGGSPASGTDDLLFRLYDGSAAGNQVGNTFPLDDITVTNGLFTTKMDFGAVFTGNRRWLEIVLSRDACIIY